MSDEKWEDYVRFKKEHPEIDVELMEDAYEKCQGKPATIEKAYKHVYEEKCGWCLKYIENAKKVEKSGILISKVRDWQVGRY